jgi:hypothetical protein
VVKDSLTVVLHVTKYKEIRADGSHPEAWPTLRCLKNMGTEEHGGQRAVHRFSASVATSKKSHDLSRGLSALRLYPRKSVAKKFLAKHI